MPRRLAISHKRDELAKQGTGARTVWVSCQP
jgi:hypothetical protein